jgi:hypothetical protein
VIASNRYGCFMAEILRGGQALAYRQSISQCEATATLGFSPSPPGLSARSTPKPKSRVGSPPWWSPLPLQGDRLLRPSPSSAAAGAHLPGGQWR